MQKVFDTYAQRKGVQATSLRFLLDGERIDASATPKMLELDDQDQIDCMLEQVCFCLCVCVYVCVFILGIIGFLCSHMFLCAFSSNHFDFFPSIQSMNKIINVQLLCRFYSLLFVDWGISFFG
jgi:small ubiquitin-related modifier